jgi:hypothetical protein
VNLNEIPAADEDFGDVWRKLAKLKTLNLDNSEITDKTLHALEGLTELRTLSVRETEVTEAGIEALKKKLPNLTVIK